MADCFINGQGGSGNSDYEFTFSTDGKFQYPTKVIIPNTVTSLQSNNQGLYQHTEIEEVEFETGSKITELNSSFYFCTGLKHITVPENVTETYRAFYGCENLDTVIFDCKNVSSITLSNKSFRNCINLNSLIFKNENLTLKLTGGDIFRGCTSLDDDCFNVIMKKMDDSMSNVSSYIFEGCTALTNVNSCIVGDNLFANCSNIVTAIISPKTLVTTYPSRVFLNCTKLNSVEIYNMKELGSNFFDGCSNLKSITLPETLTYINSYCFYGCSALEELFLPSSITTINGGTVFTGCTNLTNLSVGADWNCAADFSVLDLTVESIEGIFNNLKDLTSETAKTITLGSTNLLKTTAEQRAIATNKNWTLA